MSPRVRQPAIRFQSGSARFNSSWDTGWLPRSQRVIQTNPIRLDPYNFRNTCTKFLLCTFRDSFLAYKSEVVSETICSFLYTLAKMLPMSTTHFVTSQLITSGPPYRESGGLLHIVCNYDWLNEFLCKDAVYTYSKHRRVFCFHSSCDDIFDSCSAFLLYMLLFFD